MNAKTSLDAKLIEMEQAVLGSMDKDSLLGNGAQA
jgi:hypothetical protein